MDDSHAWIADLLRETGEAHHTAFIDTDGADPEWPIWYAGYLQERLGEKLGRQITRSELVYLLVTAEREHGAEAPAEPWPDYYAHVLLRS